MFYNTKSSSEWRRLHLSVFNTLMLFVLAMMVMPGTLPAATEYRIGSGDVVRVSVYENPDLTTIARISPTGNMRFPLIGEVKLDGLTVGEAETRLVDLLKKGGFVRHPQVTLVVEQYHSQQVAVLGEVNKPGQYVIEGASTFVDILALAGGVNAQGADRIKVIKRQTDGKSTMSEVDVIALFQDGDMSQNIEIGNEDIIYVPRMDRFYIYGEVQRPGTYRMERDMTIMQALSVAGGLTGRGTERGIKIKRRTEKGVIDVSEAELTRTVQKDDVIYVKESLF